MLHAILLASALAATAASERCSRTFLNDITGQYTDAQAKGLGLNNPMASLSSNFTYTEQFKPADINKGILTKSLNISNQLYIADPVACATFSQLIILDKSHPYVIGTRIEADGKNITRIDSLITDQGDWLFNATGYSYYQSIEHWDPIPENQTDSREVIKAAGDAYFDLFANPKTVVPWGTPCARLEGGAYTGAGNLSANTCNLGVPTNITVVNRRYVIDELMGAVNIFLGFPGLDRADPNNPTPDSHTFRVNKGKIRYIHTLSTCEGHPGCGLNGTGLPPMRRTTKFGRS